MNNNNLVLPALGALLAAIVGGAAWAAIVVSTDYEIGLIAWAIGALAAYAVVYFARRRIGNLHRAFAVIASLIGILLGKYFAFSYLLTDGMSGMFDSVVIRLFTDNITEFFSGMDIVFVLLAVWTAWQLPARLAGRAEPAQPNLDQSN